MLSSRAKLLGTLGLAALAGVLSSLLGFPRAVRRSHHPVEQLPVPPLHLRRRTVVVALVVIAAVGAVVLAGRSFRQMQDQRQAAIALTGGNPDHGPGLMLRYGCAGCHTVPGVTGARGEVGPNLSGVSRRIYIGGVATNTPDNLIRWIVRPRDFDPQTAMPVTGVSEREARDIAAFLYSR